MIKVKDLIFTYKKDSPIFQNFNWQIGNAERWSVIGPSGCGKTTLLYLLAGLRAPVSGTISIENGLNNNHRSHIGVILQDYGLLPWATASQNVALGLKIQGYPKNEIVSITRDWLTKMGIKHVAGHYPAELSGGQRQRVAIARTLAIKPSLLLMDEPFASLDTLTREDLLNLVLNLWHDLASTMILVTHNIEEAVYWGKNILVLGYPPNEKGIIVDNPGSGQPGYRTHPDFVEKCHQLKDFIEQNSHNRNPGDENE